MKIFNDIRTKFKASKVVIIYYACLISLIDQQHPRLVDLFLGVIFRKLKFIFDKKYQDHQVLTIDEDYYQTFGLTKDDYGKYDQQFLEILEGYSILLFGILGVEEQEL